MTVPGSVSNEVDDGSTPPVRELESLTIAGQADASAEVPAHRSHDPAKNSKRTDPFQFGSRYLSEGDDVFEFNAWDHVETDDAYKEYAERQFEMQRQAPVSEFDKSKFCLFFSLTFDISHPPFGHTLAQCVHDDYQAMHSSSETTDETYTFIKSFAPI